MKACVLTSVGNLVYKDVPTPSIKADEVLLKIKACGICSSDYDRVFKTGTYHFPTIPGHEFSGEIVEVGSDISAEFIGKKTVVFPLLPCNKCSECLKENYAQCSNYNYFGSRCDGAFAEYLAVPFWNIRIFSEILNYDVAALCEPTSVALHAVNLADIKEKNSVCIVGTGTIAILCGIWAKARGARVVFIGRNSKKKEFLNSLGFTECLLDVDGIENAIVETLNEVGADIALECVGSDRSLETSLMSLKAKGTLVLVGNPNNDKIIKRHTYWKILRKELTVKGSWNSSFSSKQDDWISSLDFMSMNPNIFSKLITHKFTLSNCGTAFKTMMDKSIFSVKGMFINE